MARSHHHIKSNISRDLSRAMMVAAISKVIVSLPIRRCSRVLRHTGPCVLFSLTNHGPDHGRIRAASRHQGWCQVRVTEMVSLHSIEYGP